MLESEDNHREEYGKNYTKCSTTVTYLNHCMCICSMI